MTIGVKETPVSAHLLCYIPLLGVSRIAQVKLNQTPTTFFYWTTSSEEPFATVDGSDKSSGPVSIVDGVYSGCY